MVAGNQDHEAYRQSRLLKGGCELAGRNENERKSGSESDYLGGRAYNRRAKAARLIEIWLIRLIAPAEWKRWHVNKDMLRNWRSPTHHRQKWLEQGSRITSSTGKSNEGERVADGFVLALMQSNVCGVKEPC